MQQGPLLVIGQAGQLATDLVQRAALRDLDLVALGRPQLDLTQPATITAALARVAPCAIINAAAYTAVDKAESEPDLAFAINRDGPAHLAKLCAARGIPLVHVSTDQVFDGEKAGGHVETDTPNPLCLYGRSKLAGEEVVAAANGPHLIVRVSWVFGPSGDNFVAKVLSWARAKPNLSIVSDQRGRPTYSPALADALIDLALRMATDGGETPHGLLHLAGGTVLTRDEQARLVLAGSAARGGPFAEITPVLTRDFPTPAVRPLNAELDCRLARERYGIELGPFGPDLDTTLDVLIGPRREASA
jgi:dTDP-4-dehydrorhamnose reductase